MEEEFEILKRNSAAALSAKSTLEAVSVRMEQAESELESAEAEKERLANELNKQQTLYAELKKMRGRGEEIDALKESHQASNKKKACEKILLPAVERAGRGVIHLWDFSFQHVPNVRPWSRKRGNFK